MLETPVTLPSALAFEKIEEIIEACCAAEGLNLTLKGTLAKYPGSTHRHFKKGRKRGTLEITFWPQQHRLWFKVSADRTGEWIEETVARLQSAMERAFSADDGRGVTKNVS
jgi:hypothetical protein